MTEQKLKLVKSGRKAAGTNNKRLQVSKRQRIAAQLPAPTPAEQVEAARFRALTKKRADLQARVRRIIKKLKQLDDQTPQAA